MKNNNQLFYTGDLVFKEGDLSQEIYLIKAGCVQLFQLHHGKEIEITKLSPGDIFGEMAIMDQSYRSATARVTEDALIHIIQQDNIQATLKNNPIWVNALIKVLAGRLREMTKKYNEQISEYHPFKYLNVIVNKKISTGETCDKIAHELHEMLLSKEYQNTMEVLDQISKNHHGNK